MGRFSAAVQTLLPAYFALVMATGIDSVALANIGQPVLSSTLLILGLIFFVVLLSLNAWRAARFGGNMLADAHNPARAFGYFTFVAASNVLAGRLALDGYHGAAVVLIVMGGLAWVVFAYALPAMIVFGHHDTPVLRSVDGTWFISVVGTQSVAVATATLESIVVDHARLISLLSVMMWGLGTVLYLIVATVALARLLLFPVGVMDLSPPYWIVSGATAITVFAGARLLELPRDTPVIVATRPTLLGLSVVLWAFGTWLIPMLIGLGYWRHVIHRVPLRYEPALWSICFPLGMYSVASMELGFAGDLPIIEQVGRAWVWVAVAAWIGVALLGLASFRRLVVAWGERAPEAGLRVIDGGTQPERQEPSLRGREESR